MSKPRNRRKSKSGQYVSPLLNELEWLDEEVEVKPASTKKQQQGKKTAKKSNSNKKKSGPTVKIKVAESRPAPSAPPLILIDKPKPRFPKNSWIKEWFGIDPWSEEYDPAMKEAIKSFQLGLDGILKGGEEIPLFSSASERKPTVIDVQPEDVEPEPIPQLDPEQPARPVAKEVRDLHQYGLIPFVIEPLVEWLEIAISFHEPFAGNQYAFVVTSNQPGCRVVIANKEPQRAVVRLIRESMASQLEGELNWIAMGEAAYVDYAVPTI